MEGAAESMEPLMDHDMGAVLSVSGFVRFGLAVQEGPHKVRFNHYHPYGYPTPAYKLTSYPRRPTFATFSIAASVFLLRYSCPYTQEGALLEQGINVIGKQRRRLDQPHRAFRKTG